MKVTEEILLYGAGGHARVVAECLHCQERRIVAVFDDNPEVKRFGKMDVHHQYQRDLFAEHAILIGVGDNRLRRQLASRVYHPFADAARHRSAVISCRAEVGKGSMVMHQSTIQTGAFLGQHVIVNTGAIVDHDCELEDFVHVGPGAVLCGNVSVGEGTLIGAGATVAPGVRIGFWAKIGAGAVVVRDIPDGVVVTGVPGRVIRKLETL
ncbi:sugar O-acyltransferase, sialic acid O-acetyltransferase NeuD family [Catalinimonas alkaloidigena]|uniref:Sugar O-acyltransferase, sialic acid O-acetyltransferase NeuD family n=1 Tax=Catalinimonas alkaloidigena TaxID=1075417 RepID=A0A1G9SGH2_9BACT|nr:acetyltransferase [Catalinimonas alkaloidigena]SDM34501.1 sugar O-acyltransferase, sialic acid O-acetyltransferase NeuD family [Catalinimonas alkaloidigena]